MKATGRRLCAAGSLLAATAAIVVAVLVLWKSWGALVGALVLMVVATMAIWYVLTRTGVVRVVAALIAVAAIVTAFATLIGGHGVAGIVAIVVLAGIAAGLARVALRTDAAALRTEVPAGVPVGAASDPVLILNPRSGGGKADPEFAEQARARGIRTVTLGPGDDLEALARDAVAGGADVIGMAGGDGSQALVAGIAAEHDLPFVCIPAGTRNHFALDLGVDRDDVVGALDAFMDAYERRVDLARVNGRVFVNNVSFGIYAAIVQSDEYRDAKLGTAAKMLPELLGPDYDPFDFDLDGPGDVGHGRPDLILVSNNVYKLEGVGGLGTRARLDEGVLGVIVIEVHNASELAQLVTLSSAGRGSAYAGWHEWSAPSLEIRSGKPVDAGIDGEAVTLDAPVRLEVAPAALRVRIAPHHPGVSPAAISDTVEHGAAPATGGHRLRAGRRARHARTRRGGPCRLASSSPPVRAPRPVATARSPRRALLMADPAPRADAPTDRRNRRSERRRRRLRQIVVLVGSFALLAAFALLATDLVRFGGGAKPSLAGTVHTGGGGSAAPTASTAAVAANPCRTLSSDDPLRLWIGGDSLAGSLGPALGTIAGATGVVQPYFDSRVSSGLADPGFFDWPTHATTELATINPEIIAFIIGANDWTTVSGDTWKAAYTDKVDEMMTTLVGSGRTVYWIGSPTLRDGEMDAAVVEVNAVAEEVAKRHPDVHYVDAYKLFSDADGRFGSNLPDETGKVVTMRAGDGVHFTMDGADHLARAVYELVDAQCRVTAQKVAGATKQTIESEGSTQVAPGSSSSGSSSGSANSSGSSGGGTIATTPPATAPVTDPPDTSPPATDPPPDTTAPAAPAPPTSTP